MKMIYVSWVVLSSHCIILKRSKATHRRRAFFTPPTSLCWLHFVPEELNPAYLSSPLAPALFPQQKPSGGIRRDHAAASKLQQHSEQQPPRHVPLEPLRRGQLLQADGGGAARPRVRHAQSKCVKTLAVDLDHFPSLMAFLLLLSLSTSPFLLSN